MANHQDASQSVDIKYAGIQTPHPLKGAQHMLKRDTLDTRTRPGSSVPHPGIGMPSQQHHPGRMSRLCQTGLLVQPSWTHINPTCYQLERKGTQAVDTGPMKTCAASRLARSVSGPRAASGGKATPGTRTRLALRRNRSDATGKVWAGQTIFKELRWGFLQRDRQGAIGNASLARAVWPPRHLLRFLSLIRGLWRDQFFMLSLPSCLVFIVIPDVDSFPPFSCKLLQRNLVHLPPDLLLHGLDLLFRIDLIGLCKIKHQPTPQKMGVL
jgi:hypothetical protein